MLKERQVFTDATFVSIPTVPLEQRPAHERVARAQWCQDIHQEASSRQTKQQQVPVGRGNSNFLGQQVRQSLALDGERQFSIMEETIIRDALASPLSLDAITLFGCRPPELRFLKSPTYYYSYFTRLSHKNPNKVTQKTTTEELLHQDLFKCGWVDGLDCQVLVKPQAIQNILMLSECVGKVRELFHCLNYIVHDVAVSMNYYLDLSTQDLEAMYHRFIDIKYGKDTPLPLALFNVAKPTQGNRFLIHVLLSMGKFNNEGELFAGTTMTKFFQNAQLLPINLPVTEEDVQHITRRFITEQLLFVPGGTMAFDRYCVAAYELLHATLLENSMATTDVPSYLYTTLVEGANDTTLQFHNDLRGSLAAALSHFPNVPSKEALDEASKNAPLDWMPTMIRLEDQSLDSFNEACRVLQRTCRAIDTYTSATVRPPKSVIVCGGPGTGKTFQLCVSAAYAMSRGLNVAITAAMSERSIALGGRHIHFLFCLPGENINNIHRIIDKAIRGLNKNPERLQFLRTLDVLCIDEMGYVSAEMLNVMDTILRYFRRKSSFMGGVLTLATLDHLQLQPIQAKPSLLSTLVVTSFEMVKMEEFVRARTDSRLQRIITISRYDTITSNDIMEFRYIIVNHCTHVKSWQDAAITPDMIRVVGTRQGVTKTEEEYYKDVNKMDAKIVS